MTFYLLFFRINAVFCVENNLLKPKSHLFFFFSQEDRRGSTSINSIDTELYS